MFGFARSSSTGGCTLAIEIGSASVGMAIINAPHHDEPEVLWQLREYVQIGEGTDLSEREKRVINTLISMLLALGSTGLRVLRDQYPDEVVTDILVSITAPWSYTTLHQIDYSQPKPFLVSAAFVDDLADSASTKLLDVILSEPTVTGSNITAIDITTIGVLVNDYLITDYANPAKTDRLTLLQQSSVADQLITDTVSDSIEKILPRAVTHFSATMPIWQKHIATRFPLVKECAIIDVTSEATELGIIRDGVLTHTSHILFGSYSIAREIAATLHITNEEAHSYLQLDQTEIAALPETSRTVLATVLEHYQVELREMLTNTGDELLIPDSVFLLADPELMSIFSHYMKQATESTTGTSHTIHALTPKALNSPIADVALFMTAVHGRQRCAHRE